MNQSPIPKRVFITGALGLIGRRLADRYRNAGASVAGVDMRGDPERGVVSGDITEPGSWQDSMRGADLVIHTAAKVGMQDGEESFWRINCCGTRHVLDAAARHGIRRFVHISSVVAFGFDYPDGVDEHHPLRTNGVPYVDTKVASEQVVLQAHAAGEIACTIIRPGDVYGPGSHYWTIRPTKEIAARRLVLPEMGRGHLSPVFVDDLVEGIVLAAGKDAAVGQVFTLTGGEKVETREFFGHYARMLGKSSIPVAPTAIVLAIAATVGRVIGGGDITPAAVRFIARRGGYSIEKARAKLGYQPATNLEVGMRRTQAWLQENGFLQQGGGH